MSPLDELRAAQRGAEAIRLLAALEPYLDAIVCYASSMDDHIPNRIVFDVRRVVADAHNNGTA